MAKKPKTVFVCTECGYESPKWQGQCICGAWNTMVEQKVPQEMGGGNLTKASAKYQKPIRLGEVGAEEHERFTSGISELDRVLGGGIVPGALMLISGEPGIGKSTMIVQSANSIAEKSGRVLYVTGEESEEQVKLRADRVCGKISENLWIYPETNAENIIAACEEAKPTLVVIDSIQTMYTDEVDATAGSVSQIRACSNILMKFAKTNDVAIFIVAHVTKSGDLAGPKTIEHMVDCVLSFFGERNMDLRILRAVKNRFGTTEEVGAFKMCATGMEEVSDLSGSLLEDSEAMEEGAVISAIYEGSRPIFFEVQGLVAPANVGFARRTSVGIDNNRLSMILAVLEKRAGTPLLNYDVYVNVVGGMRPDSPATDLAVALSLYGSLRERISPRKVVAIGEIGLTGRLRSVRGADKIAAEAKRLGYEAVILPKKNANIKVDGIEILGAENINDAIRLFTHGGDRPVRR